jgi:putative alpha-1,2-mannosidase
MITTTARRLRIETTGRGAHSDYIAQAALNGKALDRSWLHHREIAGGGTLSLTLGDTPTDWGRGVIPE